MRQRKDQWRKEKARMIFPYVLPGALTVFACWFFVGRFGVFGAKMDWISQHSVLPDYFRQQFYETRELFPEFAANIGGGQNIYNFSYYGLYSPVVLYSYLLPFVKMSDYLMAVSVLGLSAAVMLFCFWLGKRGFSWRIRFPVAVMFLLAGPMIYQSYHQVMFINYMPFLCMAFLGVDRYFEKGKSGLYTFSIFLMIMTSFYFSIGGMLVLVLYGVSRYLKMHGQYHGKRYIHPGIPQCMPAADARCPIRNRLTVLQFLKDGIQFIIPMFTAVLMSGILLVPTALALMGKRESTKKMDILSLLIPDIPILRFVYSGYGIGLTTLILTVLLTGLTYKKWHERILAYGCVLILTVPIFAWLLNGGLYVRDKVMIPFLPLLCYLTAVYLDKQKKWEISFRVGIAAYLLTLGLLCYGHFRGQVQIADPQKWYLILTDGILMLICFFIFWRRRYLPVLIVPSVLCLFLFGSVFHNVGGQVLSKDDYEKVTNQEIGEAVSEVLDAEEGFFRLEQDGTEDEKAANLNRIWDTRQWVSSLYSSVYNAEYQDFRKRVFGVEEPFRNDLMQAASKNPLYRKLMGVKYIVGEQKQAEVKKVGGEKAQGSKPAEEAGYGLYKKIGDLYIYKNEKVAPIAYATNQIISEKEYEQLKFPYNQTALMKYAVVENSRDHGTQWGEDVKKMAKAIEISLPEMSSHDARIEKKEDRYHIQTKKKTKVKIPAAQGNVEKEQMLYLQFRVKNNRPSQDVAVWLNGIRNKLSAKEHIYYNGNTMFTYVTELEEGYGDVEIAFGKGDYEISDVKCFLGDADILEDGGKKEDAGDGIVSNDGGALEENGNLYQSEFQVDQEKTKGNRIQGKINVKRTGYFLTSIPYDSNFEVIVDGKKMIAKKVNTAFLGFPIKAGEHQIEMIYHAPGAGVGKLMSCAGLALWILVCYIQRGRQHIT